MSAQRKSVTRDEALSKIVDSPATVEFRALALDRQSTILRSGRGLLLLDKRRTLLAAVGAVVQIDVERFHDSEHLECEVLADPVALAALGQRWLFARATIAVLEGAWRRPAHAVSSLTVRPLVPDDRLDHVPEQLRADLESQRQTRLVLAGFLGGVAVSFASSPWVSERFADISIDTLADYRQRGIGRAVVSALIDHVVASDKTPVWGATVDNLASLALAASLGFTRQAGELFVHEGRQ